MPPKKKPAEEPEDSQTAPDPIAEATDSLLSNRANTSSRENAESQPQNGTSFQSWDRSTSESRLAADPYTEEGVTSDAKGSGAEPSEKDRLPGPYVPSEVSYALQEVQVKLRRMTGKKVSQSLIIQCALEICISDFEQQGTEGVLATLVRERVKE